MQSEAHVLAHIPYENIIKIVGKGTGELNNKKVCFFVMKWISGGSLYDRMEGISYMIYVVLNYMNVCLLTNYIFLCSRFKFESGEENLKGNSICITFVVHKHTQLCG